jgi:Zn-dependent protease
MALERIPNEIRDIVIADLVLTIAFASTEAGGILFSTGTANFLRQFVYYLPIAALAVTLSFVLHELMHKFVAQHYGAIAGFRTSVSGLAVTLITGLAGFLLGIPGATWIYTNRFTKRENGIVSLAGPLTNFVVFVVFLAIGYSLFGFGFLTNTSNNSYAYSAISFTIFISILLAFFNMLPIYPLDGSKVLAWNKWIYMSTMAVIFVLMLFFTGIGLVEVIYFILIALVFSLFFRRMF